VAKAGTSLQALRGLAGSTWGVALSSMRCLYQAIIVPQMLYGVASWFRPDADKEANQRAYQRLHVNTETRGVLDQRRRACAERQPYHAG
jgi:hypothetical protein